MILFHALIKYAAKPQLYTPGTSTLWDDVHISKGMLKAHLDPDGDAATRKHAFLDKSVCWISQIAPPTRYKRLLDLGCGPGLYAERFHRAGYSVTGIDFSKRSIEYAKKQAKRNNSNIEYHYQNYLTIDYTQQFDVVTLIYCDYAALPAADRLALLEKIYKALKADGKFIFDVSTDEKRSPEGHTWYCSESGGFYSPEKHICLNSVYQYDNDDRAELRRSVVITDDSVQCYHVWEHFFTKEKLIAELKLTGFNPFEIYGSVVGEDFTDSSETICGVFTK
ncbi:MAG: class I SAM-dependent methyltransferase [Oscillospiraceae bacterium]|nr:class I SAM-dependent methyltransferase [Oscillospiraceae bacterium]